MLGLLEREKGEVRALIAPSNSKRHFVPNVYTKVAVGSSIYTDSCVSYAELGRDFAHQMVDHISAYSDGRVHTNDLENFWSLLKRTLKGTYVSVDPSHLFRDLAEQCFRFNKRRLLMQSGF